MKAGGFVCQADRICTYPYAACNGVKDCSDGADEDPALCGAYNCSLSGSDYVSGSM